MWSNPQETFLAQLEEKIEQMVFHCFLKCNVSAFQKTKNHSGGLMWNHIAWIIKWNQSLLIFFLVILWRWNGIAVVESKEPRISWEAKQV